MSDLLPVAAVPATGQYTARITPDGGTERLFVGGRTALITTLRTETGAKPAEAERMLDGFEHLERIGDSTVQVALIDDLFAAAAVSTEALDDAMDLTDTGRGFLPEDDEA